MESGYHVDFWRAWMAEHATRRADGRVTHLGGRMIPESHRNTIELWYAHAELVPLGRWDEILVAAGLHLAPDFEQWLEERFGWDGLTLSPDCDILETEELQSPNTEVPHAFQRSGSS